MTTSNENPDKPRAPRIDPTVRRRRRRPSSVWVIPLVAAFLGAVLVFQHYTSQGPTARVRFDTAEGIVAGKTEVRCRSVNVGIVETVSLTDDLKYVVATVRIDLDSANLLNQGSRFWVVRPRIGGGGFSGLNTILSGPYIELDPGLSDEKRDKFVGLEQPPATPMNFPGVHFNLVSDEAGALSVGSPISFKGLQVGKIESRDFDPDLNKVVFGAFVEEPYDKLIYIDTKFWNTSGIDLEVGANGIQLRTGTFESLFSGGVSFDAPADAGHTIFPITSEKVRVANGTTFPLYESFSATRELNLENCPDYLLLFEDSIRGLANGAPVEFRGIQVGTVTDISLNYRLLGEDPGKPSIPVFIKIDPLRLRLTDFPPNANTPAELLRAREQIVGNAVAKGLRASLRTGSFLTGQLYVDLEFDEDDTPREVGRLAKFAVLPTTSSGLARIEESLVAVLEKLEALPIEETLTGATVTLAEFKTAAEEVQVAVRQMRETATALTGFVASEGTQKIPDDLVETLGSLRETLAAFNEQSVAYKDLTRTLDDLRDALRSITSLTDTVGRQPNSLIFGKPSTDVEPPRAKVKP